MGAGVPGSFQDGPEPNGVGFDEGLEKRQGQALGEGP